MDMLDVQGGSPLSVLAAASQQLGLLSAHVKKSPSVTTLMHIPLVKFRGEDLPLLAAVTGAPVPLGLGQN
jgi:hypothetical protein